MIVAELEQLRPLLEFPRIIDLMREALMAQARGECDTPLPMHIDIPAEKGEVHVKSSYRRGGPYFVLKVASTFPNNVGRGISTGNGAMLLSSAETGAPVALLQDAGHLTDVRTAAAGAMVARELKRKDEVLGILGTGIQAHLQAQMHAAVLPLREIQVWGRTDERVTRYCEELKSLLPKVRVEAAESPAAVARKAKLIVTTTASRGRLLSFEDLQPGTHISAVGADGPGKQELDPLILTRASLLLVDSRAQCERLGELQHAPSEKKRAVEVGAYCISRKDAEGLTVCDFTGLGVEDLYIAEYCYERLKARGGR